MPVRTPQAAAETGKKFPRPVHILSKRKLFAAWKNSRDSTTDPGRPGIDGVTATQFAARLELHLDSLAKSLRSDNYRPSRLRAVFIPKPNSSKERLICIPIIRDRIVQKAIVNYLVQNRKLPIENDFSYGFIRGRGTKQAIRRAIELRSKYDWCIKSDIEAFFDRIPRSDAKARIAKALPNSSLTPLLHRMVDCEIKETKAIRPKLAKQGIKAGVGLRQGMPISPLIANLVLADFDASVKRAKIEMVRYADDLLLCFHTKQEAMLGLTFIRGLLAKQGLNIPELDDSSKTQIIAPKQPLNFLGLELVYLDSENRYVQRVGRKQLAKIQRQIEDDYNFETLSGEGKNFQNAMVDLWRSISSYRGAYRDAHDYPTVDSELRRVARAVLTDIFKDIFGDAALNRVSAKGRDFLGIGDLDLPEPTDDLDS
jgi:RNA-directed DNA polymerase